LQDEQIEFVCGSLEHILGQSAAHRATHAAVS